MERLNNLVGAIMAHGPDVDLATLEEPTSPKKGRR